MSTDESQANGEMIIKADLGENGGLVAFGSLREAKEWIDDELEKWERFKKNTDRINPFPDLMKRQLRLPLKIRENLEGLLRAGYFEQPREFRGLVELLERYADYESVCSRSAVGAAIQGIPLNGRFLLMAVGGLASVLGIPAHAALHTRNLNDNQLLYAFSGYALGRSVNVIKRSELPEHQFRMEEQLARLEGVIERAGKEKDELNEAVTRANQKLGQAIASVASISEQALASARKKWDTLRATFEQDLHLRAPAAYWREQASRTQAAAMQSLGAFTVLAVQSSAPSWGWGQRRLTASRRLAILAISLPWHLSLSPR